MAFRPAPGRHYFLLAKHSDMPMGVHGNSGTSGTDIEQQALDPQHAQQQHFWFDAAPGQHVYIKPGHRDLYLEPVGSHEGHGREDGTHIVQATWNANAENQRFLLMEAGNGYYRIQCRHTGNFMDVYGATAAVGALLTQHRYMPGDNQLFRLEQVVDNKLVSPISFKKHSDLLREATLGVIGLIPKAGGGIKAVLGVLWPDQHDQDFWNQMVAYVDERIRTAIEKVLLNDMKLTLEGARTNLVYYGRLNDAGERAMKLTAVITDLIGKQGKYLRERDEHQTWISIKVLPYLVAYGTLLLCAQAERVHKHSQLFPQQTEADRQVQIGILQEEMALFNDAIAAARTQALQDRLNLITKRHFGQTVKYNTNTFYRVEDKFDGWYGERVHSQNGAGSFHDPRAEAHVHTMYLARRAQVTEQYNAELDALLASARVWRFLDPTVTARPTSEKVTRALGPYGGASGLGGTTFAAHAGELRKLTLYRAPNNQPHIVGLTLTYDDGTVVSSGVITDRKDELQLAEGEYITSVYGHEGDYIHGLTFDTNKGHRLQCLADHSGWYSYDFVSGVDNGLPNVRLSGIAGTLNDYYVSMTFHWTYEWKYDWAAAALLAADAPEPRLLAEKA